MFDIERFVESCRAIQAAGDNQAAVRELVAEAVSDPAALMQAVGEPTHAGIHTLYQSDDLTILNLVWGPYMTLMPHNHNMWAVIGIYTGREDNIFWKRQAGAPDGHIEAAAAKALCPKDCVPLGKDIIHSVTNPVPRLTGALHVYGGDFFNEARSEWDPQTLAERPWDVAAARALFEASNARLEVA